MEEDLQFNQSKLDLFKSFFKDQKKALSILGVVLLLITIPLGVYLVQEKQIFKPKAFETKLTSVENKKAPLYRGYIVELQKEPVAKLIKRLKDSGKKENEIKKEANSYQKILDDEHQKAKVDILAKLGKKNITTRNSSSKDNLVLWREYKNTFNGLALDINDTQAQKVKSSPFVKNVYKNNQAKTTLSDSVPMINADDVWQLKDQTGNSVTGKGINIAIVDTGIDVTHPDLGASTIPEREFQQIIADSGDGLAVSSDQSKFAFYKWDDMGTPYDYEDDRGVFYIYSSSGEKLKEFSLQKNETFINYGNFVIEGDYLAFYAMAAYGEEAGVSVYNLTTGEHAKIEKTNVEGTMHIYNNTLYYGIAKSRFPDGFGFTDVQFTVYDLLTGNLAHSIPSATPHTIATIQAAFDKDRVVFPVPEKDGDICAKYIVIHKFDGSWQQYSPPEVGSVLDFKGDEVLYIACNETDFDPTASTKYLYNIKTGQSTKLAYASDSGLIGVNVDKNYNGLLTKTEAISPQTSTYNFHRYNQGLIGDDVVYFDKNWDANKIIIYNKSQQKYYLLNISLPINHYSVRGNTIYFPSGGIKYHTYNLDDPYDWPSPSSVFNNKVVSGYNFVDPDYFPLDDYGHGTHVASITAGNGVLKGVAPEAKLITYKVMNAGGYGYVSDIIAAMEMGVDTRLDSDPRNDIGVMNFSLGADCSGSYSPNCGPDDPMSQAVDNAVDIGIVMVVAAGNSGSSPQTIGSPGTARKALTVGAVDKNKQIASFSSRGPVIWGSETVNKPDVVAPGVSICAAEWDGWLSDRRCVDDKHIAIDGTSMATPHVAGVAALIKQMYPDLSALEIKEAVKNGAKDLGYDINTQGKGLVDVLSSIQLLAPTPTNTPTPKPRVCLQVITYASDPITGECQKFPNSCIPEGWEKVRSCINTKK